MKRLGTITLLSMLIIGLVMINAVAQQTPEPEMKPEGTATVQPEGSQPMEESQPEQAQEPGSQTQPSGRLNITKEPFGEINGQSATLYTLTNSNGIEVQITDYEGIVVSIKAPDRDGNFENVVLGHETLDNYIRSQNTPYFVGIRHQNDERFHGLIWDAEEFSDEERVGLILRYDISKIAQRKFQSADEEIMAATMKIEDVRTNRELLEEGREGVENVKDVAKEIAEDAEDVQEKALDTVDETTELSEAMAEVSQTAGDLKKQAQAVVQAAEQQQQSAEESIQGSEEQVARAQDEQNMLEDRQKDVKQDLISRSLITIRYTLTENNALRLDYTVDSGKEAELNVDSSMYFNLAGAGTEDLGEHKLFVRGDEEGMQPFSAEHIGGGIPVTYGQTASTGMEPTGMEAQQEGEHEVRQVSGTIETWEVTPNDDGTPALAARVLELKTGRVVEIQTTAQSLTFNTGTFMGGEMKSQETMPEQEATLMSMPEQQASLMSMPEPEVAPEATPEQEATPMAQTEQQVGATDEQQRAFQQRFDPRYSGFYVSIQQFPEALETVETPEEMAADTEESSAESQTSRAYSYTIVYKFYAM